MPKPPSELAIGETRYTLDPALVAMRASSASEPTLTRALWILEGTDIAVIRASDLPQRHEPLGPVYRGVPGGGLAVPTGRVFVRFDEKSEAAEREPELRRAGYVLDASADWSRDVAWVTAVDGGVEAALSGLAGLLHIRGLQHAEPELLRRREQRRATL
jgi:hypothetical protein